MKDHIDDPSPSEITRWERGVLEIVNRIRHEFDSRPGLSQDECARHLGISDRSVRKYLNEKRLKKIDVLLGIAEYLRVSPASLLPGYKAATAELNADEVAAKSAEATSVAAEVIVVLPANIRDVTGNAADFICELLGKTRHFVTCLFHARMLGAAVDYGDPEDVSHQLLAEMKSRVGIEQSKGLLPRMRFAILDVAMGYHPSAMAVAFVVNGEDALLGFQESPAERNPLRCWLPLSEDRLVRKFKQVQNAIIPLANWNCRNALAKVAQSYRLRNHEMVARYRAVRECCDVLTSEQSSEHLRRVRQRLEEVFDRHKVLTHDVLEIGPGDGYMGDLAIYEWLKSKYVFQAKGVESMSRADCLSEDAGSTVTPVYVKATWEKLPVGTRRYELVLALRSVARMQPNLVGKMIASLSENGRLVLIQMAALPRAENGEARLDQASKERVNPILEIATVCDAIAAPSVDPYPGKFLKQAPARVVAEDIESWLEANGVNYEAWDLRADVTWTSLLDDKGLTSQGEQVAEYFLGQPLEGLEDSDQAKISTIFKEVSVRKPYVERLLLIPRPKADAPWISRDCPNLTLLPYPRAGRPSESRSTPARREAAGKDHRE